MELENRNSSDDEILPEARVFEFRAQNILQLKLQAMQEMWNKTPDDMEDSKKDEDEEKKKPRGRKPKQGKSKSDGENGGPIKTRRRATPMEENEDDSPPRRSRRGATPTGENEESPPKRSKRAARAVDYEDASPPKKARRGRKKAKIVEEIGSIDPEDLISSIKLPAVSRRRIQELKLNSSRHKRRIDMENERILSACDAAPTEVELQPPEQIESEQSIILKIKFLSDISKLTVKLTDKFTSIYDKVADMHNLKASEILLCIRDQTIKPTDTPLFLNLKYFDILDCFPYKPSDDKLENDALKFLLKMQSNDTRKKINVYGSRFEKFKGFMKQYSEMRNIPMEKLSFEFDGEKIEESETPEDLEMESGSCIDVKVMTESSIINTNSDSDIEMTAEIVPESDRLQICVLD